MSGLRATPLSSSTDVHGVNELEGCILTVSFSIRQRQHLSRTYLPHHGLESEFITISIIFITVVISVLDLSLKMSIQGSSLTALLFVLRNSKQKTLSVPVSIRPTLQNVPVANVSDSSSLGFQEQQAMDPLECACQY